MALTGLGSELEHDTIVERVKRLEGRLDPDMCWESLSPLHYRLRKTLSGELILQGEYQSGGTKDGIPYNGYEWKDIETVEEK